MLSTFVGFLKISTVLLVVIACNVFSKVRLQKMSYCYHDTTHSMSEICLNSWQDGYYGQSPMNQTLQMQCVPTIVYPGWDNFFTHVLIYLLPGVCIYSLDHLEDFC